MIFDYLVAIVAQKLKNLDKCKVTSKGFFGEKKMNPFWSIVYFWKMTRFWWNFWWRSGPITSFFCTYFQVHWTCFKKVKSKNAFFHVFKNVKKHIHDAKNSSSQLSALWIFFIFWIRVKTIDSYFFRYSKRDLESNWRF